MHMGFRSVIATGHDWSGLRLHSDCVATRQEPFDDGRRGPRESPAHLIVAPGGEEVDPRFVHSLLQPGRAGSRGGPRRQRGKQKSYGGRAEYATRNRGVEKSLHASMGIDYIRSQTRAGTESAMSCRPVLPERVYVLRTYRSIFAVKCIPMMVARCETSTRTAPRATTPESVAVVRLAGCPNCGLLNTFAANVRGNAQALMSLAFDGLAWKDAQSNPIPWIATASTPPSSIEMAVKVPIIPRQVWESVGDPAKYTEPAAMAGPGPYRLEFHDNTRPATRSIRAS